MNTSSSPRRRILGWLLALLLACTGLTTLAAPATAQSPVQVTVTVIRFIQDAPPDPVGGNGEYFAGVCWPNAAGSVACDVRKSTAFLVNHQKTSVYRDDTADVTPFWTLTRTFDRATASTARFTLLIWDRDPAANAPDDVMDVNPRDDQVTLTFLVDLFTGDWIETSVPTGSIPANTGFARGDGDTASSPGWIGPGGEPGRVLFDISLSDDGDGDDDGIPDGIERTAVRDGNGTVVANLAALGADPCRKTVLVEVDFMETAGVGHSHRPKPTALTEVEAAFDNAGGSVPARTNCPYARPSPPRPGIQLIVQVDDPVPERFAMAGSLAAACSQGLPDIRDTAGFFNPGRRPYFHYSLWAHDLAAGVTNSGVQCRNIDGRDFIVSLGSWSKTCVIPGADGILSTTPTGDDIVIGTRIDNGPNRTCDSTAAATDLQFIPVGTGPANDSVGTVREQSATFMHELGHALGLGHGGPQPLTQTGNAQFNFKPNYLSVMNYHFGATGIFRRVAGVVTSRIDYSTSKLATLAEGSLNETTGIGVGADLTAWFDPAGRLRFSPVSAGIDWDFDTGGAPPLEPSVSVDVNGSRRCIGAGPGPLATSPTPGSDDTTNTVGDAIVTGPDNTCQTTTATGGDTNLVETDRPCVATGGDDRLTTTPVPDDARVLGKWIGIGVNRVCNTTADPGRDFQSTPVGTTEPTVPLTGAVDWTGLNYSSGLGGVGAPFDFSTTPVDLTVDEALRLQAFWRDVATVPEVAGMPAEAPLLGPILVSFTEAVEAVTADNLILRRTGDPTPIPVTRSCRDAAEGTVGCGSPSVTTVVLRPAAALVPGEHYQVAVNPPDVRPVTDPAGNPVPPATLSLRGSLQETERSVAAGYTWQPVKDVNAAGGSYTREHLKGATATFTFRGTSVTWYTITGPDQGVARVFLDGNLVQTLDQHDPTTSYRIARTFPGLTPGPHTITIEATGQADPAATDTFVSVDAFRVGEESFETPDLDYTWQPNTAFEDPGQVHFVRSDLPRSRATFTFRGTGVTLFTVHGPSHGRFEALVDGQSLGIFDTYRPNVKPGVPEFFGGLPDKLHTITVVVRGTAQPASAGRFVAVDGWMVQ